MMNERIQKLIEESGFILWEDEPWGPGAGRIDWASDYSDEINLFISKLINECCTIMEEKDSFYGEWMGNVIKEHFGVTND